AGTIGITVPYEPVAGNLTLNSFPEGKGATVEYFGTDSTFTNVVDSAAAKQTTTLALPLATGAKRYFRVTAADGVTQKQYTITFTRATQTPKTAIFNFDGVASNRADAHFTLRFQGLANEASPTGYTFTDSNAPILGLGISSITSSGNINLNATASEYYKNINDTPSNWTIREVGNTSPGIKVASHERTVTLSKNGTVIGTFTAHTNNASATDLAVVLGIDGKLKLVDYLDAFQKGADAAGAAVGHPQKDGSSFPVVETVAQANAYLKTYLDKAVADYKNSLTAGEILTAMDEPRHQVVINQKEFIPPVAGTAELPEGNDGLYTFTVTVACGKTNLAPGTTPTGAAMESTEQQIIIQAHP
ncbi:MAG: hypothetical protein RR185_09750, partial [Angelakisella sp.]